MASGPHGLNRDVMPGSCNRGDCPGPLHTDRCCLICALYYQCKNDPVVTGCTIFREYDVSKLKGCKDFGDVSDMIDEECGDFGVSEGWSSLGY